MAEFADIKEQLAMCGLTQEEASTYLKARGHPASMPAFRSWSKGAYKVPPGISEDLNALYEMIVSNDDVVDERGIEIPAGALTRRKTLRRQQAWREFMAKASQNVTEPPRDDD